MAMKPRVLDLNDDLSDLIGSPRREVPPSPPETFVPVTERIFTEPCAACGGSGRWQGRFKSGRCFKCDGTGKRQFKTAPEARSGSARQRQAKKEEQRATLLEELKAWIAAHKAEVDWLNANLGKNPSWTFPGDMMQALARFGSLTDNQLAAVRKCMARDAERDAERAKLEAQAPAVDISRIEQAFASARASGLKRLNLRLDAFEFRPAGPNSRWAGSLYVTEGEQYLGRITDGRFVCTRECGDARRDRVLAAAADPAAAAVAYGKLTGRCSCCGAELTNPESISRGIGPICAGRYGW